MANLRRHLPFNLSKPPPAPPVGQPTGRSLFYASSLDAHHYGNSMVTGNSSNNGAPQTTPSSSNLTPLPPGPVLVKQLQEALTLCNAYTQELTVLCNAGVRTARCLSSVLKEVPAADAGSSSQLPSSSASPQQIAGQFLEAWNHLTLATGGAVTAVQQGALAALQDITARLEANQKVASGANNPLTDDSSKILVGCLMTVIQLQYQFSLSICESLVDLAIPLPEEGMPSSQKRSSGLDDNGARGKSPEFLHACVDSLAGIQRNFSSCMNKLSQKTDVTVATTTTTITLPSQNPLYAGFNNQGVALRTGQRRVSEVITRQTGDMDTDSSIRRRWSIAGVNRGCSVAADDQLLKQWGAPSSADSQSVWCPNVPLQTAHASWNENSDSNFKKSHEGMPHRRSVFASNEELQDVISLLSCQPSNPSSPTSDSSANSHPVSGGASAGDGHSFLWPTTGSLTNVMLSNYSQEKECEGSNLNQMETSPQLGPWPEATADVNFVWGVPPAKDPKSTVVPSFEFADAPVGYPIDNMSQTTASMHPSLAAFRDVGSNGCGINPLSDGQMQHARATKSTSWPVMEAQSKTVPSNNMDTNNSSDQEDSFNGNGCHEKEAAFFMGLDLVGNDLMASVRQRRHSSGGTFTENGHVEYPSPSIRTKSIDNISLDEKCSKTSTWPLKQPSPKSSYSSMYVSNVQKMTSEDQVSQVWSLASDFPHGLPPSGIENRCKPKMERKYSLFGHAP